MDFFRDLNSVQLAVSEYENEEIDKKTHTVNIQCYKNAFLELYNLRLH